MDDIYVNIMDDEEMNQSREDNYEQPTYYQEDNTLGMDLQLSGDEDEGQASHQQIFYQTEIPAAEDSQMSFNAEMFFQANFNVAGERLSSQVDDSQADPSPLPMGQVDVVNTDLHLSESEEEGEDVPSEGTGFDFDEFDN